MSSVFSANEAWGIHIFMFIQRHIERKFTDLLKDYPVVCLVGPRQVGKTSFIKAFWEGMPDQSLYLDLEMPTDMSKLSDPQFYLEQHSDKTIIIDEVQHRRDLFTLLRAMIDADRRPGRFILLGSGELDELEIQFHHIPQKVILTSWKTPF